MGHWTFEPGELALPIHKILWAPTNEAHENHLHVEGFPPLKQNEMPTNGIWTPAIGEIVDALDARFGSGEHFIIDPDAAWTHMGVYNPRYIAGTTIWSQHAGANAIDIGPYYGVEEQQLFYDFLTGKEEDMFKYLTIDEQIIDVALNRGWVQPNTQASRDYWISIKNELNNPNSTHPDALSFKKAFTRGLVLDPGDNTQRSAAEIRQIIADAIANG